ncbi:MAG: PhnD/SsuA/transferrin family substrate-binding protein [Sulfuriferula sp.]|nr:PhnD/SsuA/transferrin family substrate-binding protein [Sulfuriferula sp.]
MNRRLFVQSLLAATLSASYPAQALLLSGSTQLTMAIYPGTGAEDMPIATFQESTKPLTDVLSKKIGKKVYSEPYRSFGLLYKAIDGNVADTLLVPPIAAAYALQHGYQPLVRIQDMATGTLIKRKGQAVTRIGMTESSSWLGAVGADLVAKHSLVPTSAVQVVKTQDAVVYLLEQKAVQAAVLRTEKANKLIATGEYEVWYELPKTPDLTLLIHEKLATSYAESMRQAMVTLPAEVIKQLQIVIHVPIKQFVSANQQDYSVLSKLLKK